MPSRRPDEVILIRQFRYAIGRWIWELPAGSLEAGEAPRAPPGASARRKSAWRPRRLPTLAALLSDAGLL